MYIVAGIKFTCSLSHAKKSFSRSVNAIFGNVLNSASNDVLIQLIKMKSLPILMHGTEAILLAKHQLSSLDFTVVRFFMKILRTANRDYVTQYLNQNNFDLPSILWTRRFTVFKRKFESSDNLLCKSMLYNRSFSYL